MSYIYMISIDCRGCIVCLCFLAILLELISVYISIVCVCIYFIYIKRSATSSPRVYIVDVCIPRKATEEILFEKILLPKVSSLVSLCSNSSRG